MERAQRIQRTFFSSDHYRFNRLKALMGQVYSFLQMDHQDLERRAESSVPYLFNAMSAVPKESVRRWAERNTEAREAERLRIAQDIHDDVGSTLTGLKLQLALAQKQCGLEDLGALTTHLTLMESLIDRTMDSMRRLSTHLRPPVLDGGLIPALEWLIDDANAQHLSSVDRILDTDIPGLPEETALGLFRICQEALQNAFKHARAENILVALHRDTSYLYLEIIDNGSGFDPNTRARTHAYGLSGMRERALHIGATLTVDSEPGQGTLIRVRVDIAR